ncbi:MULTISPECIES: S8 family peptidase [unclassified Streptomyces]|uniref:S8 family peptidase n=1 Tax=unclassified Streptomyces TaxID=2593676 RepID=UPI001660FD6A|nr:MULTISPECIES: S8 family serine peptidase [unclassified Streptomyces]MBD0709635.1 peptidase S8 [Streptomyces sp. CBMA291]MBD0713980.1 peptidase S8 [Streptomyces sp. CBMA370]MBD0715241.1 peptidase S8 [Streptomyces sp. CBMA370]
MKRAHAFTVAAATSVALAAGMTGPATAVVTRTAAPSDLTRVSGDQRIPLVTGDRVLVNAQGRMVGFEPAPGREHIPVQVQRVGDRTLVVPGDARQLLASGRLDQRLFDLGVLSDPRLRKSHGSGLKLIVRYAGGAATARAEVRAAGDTEVRRTFPTLGAEAVTASQDDLAKVWEALTNRQKSGARTAAAGIATVWLDGVRSARLDRSVTQIGADKAWESGYDGTGVKIAVLDTGVDKTHEDLATQVVGERNFSSSPDAVDRVGHGTHVASIAAGTGAKSGGRYKGVAPGAKVLSGKVLDDDGYGDDSGIIAGMEWAAAEGADVVNLSLGSPDSPGTDPLEAAVDRLSAEKGILFAVAAGNEGEYGASSVGSPGSADSALTVGAVDKDDKLAPFSSIGPRVGDGAVKPDLTAPGVAIAAAAAAGSTIDTEPGRPHPAPGYLQLDGTSMATPHVAGAAAILKQRHPLWKPAELKGALTGSTRGGAYTAFQQGSGRVQVDKALGQSVITEQVSLNYGTARWPHQDDTPATKKVTYRNLGSADVTLDLSVATLDPAGKPAPAGFFSLGASQVTVPAGGTADVDLVADTRVGDTDGAFSGYVTATAAGQSVRTAAVAVREEESYDVTIRTLGRDGADAAFFANDLIGVAGPAAHFQGRIDDQSGSRTLRVPKGSYTFNTAVYADPSDYTQGTDWIAQPKLEITGDTTLVADARTTKPVDLTVPGIDQADYAGTYYERATDIGRVGNGWVLRGFTGFRTAHLGPAVTDGSLLQTWDAHFLKDATSQYSVAYGGATNTLATGYTKHVRANELATLKVRLGASAPGKTSLTSPFAHLPGAPEGNGFSAPQPAPGTRTFYVSTGDNVSWLTRSTQAGEPDEWGYPAWEGDHAMARPKRYEAGRTYQETFNTGVFGPLLDENSGVFRTAPDPETGAEQIVGSLSLFADGQGHPGSAPFGPVTSTLYRDGVKVGENSDPLTGWEPFTVGADDAAYRLTTSVERPAGIAPVSTRVETDFTFRSKRVAATTALPVSTVRFAAPVDLGSRLPARALIPVPLKVQGSAAGGNLKSLTVSASYDGGQTWQPVPVQGGLAIVKSPAKDSGVSLSAKVTDKQGNVSAVTIHNAWLGK